MFITIIMCYLVFIIIRGLDGLYMTYFLCEEKIIEIMDGNYDEWYIEEYDAAEFVFDPRTYHIWFGRQGVKFYKDRYYSKRKS